MDLWGKASVVSGKAGVKAHIYRINVQVNALKKGNRVKNYAYVAGIGIE